MSRSSSTVKPIVDEPRYLRYVQVKEPHLQAVETIASDKDYAFVVAAGNPPPAPPLAATSSGSPAVMFCSASLWLTALVNWISPLWS